MYPMRGAFDIFLMSSLMSSLKETVDGCICRVSGLDVYCSRFLRTERWGGCVVLMVVDAAFTSIGLNYFTAVVPRVETFSKRFVVSRRIRNLKELAEADINELREVWRNRRSWAIAKGIASYLSTLSEDDKTALRAWAANARLENWWEDPVGRIKGVGLVTFQYLRMMGGVDTVMPDKIVKRVVNGILVKAGLESVEDDMEFIKKAEQVALACGYRPIELCWMTWLIQPEGIKMRMEKYRDILPKI
jgi:hypothetical protein